MPASAARVALAAALAAACLGVPAHAPAQAAAPPVTLLSGLLTVSLAPAAASLTASGGTASGVLGTTTVIDGRLASGGYDISVTTTGFALVGSAAGATTRAAASAVSARASAATGGTLSTTAFKVLPASPLARLSYGSSVHSLDLVSTYTLALSVALPTGAAPGLWTGTVTQTVA